MTERVVLVTGATDGIGKQTALEIARGGARVIIHGRDPGRCRAALLEIRQKTGSSALESVVAEFSSLAQVRRMAERMKGEHPRLCGLVNNAGTFMKKRVLTGDGLETTFSVNHIAPFLLTLLLLDCLRAGAAPQRAARIVTVSSMLHSSGKVDFQDLQAENHYDGMAAYCSSKLANVLFTYRLAGMLDASEVTVNCLHPGGVDTKLLHEAMGMRGISVEKGAATSVYLAESPEVEGVTGKYFVDRRPAASSAASHDARLGEELWRVSERLAGLA
jgi:retinol dehydrogenase-14